MLLVETEPINASVRLILREPKVSNFCKSWLYLKAMVDNNDDNIIRIQLENGYNHWEFEDGMEQTLLFILTGLILIEKINSPRSLL